MHSKDIWLSALLDFVITFGTVFIALPKDEISAYSLIAGGVGALVASAKGVRTYMAKPPQERGK